MKNEIIIDAKGKKPGRLASEVAYALRGKTGADFLPHATIFPKVVVKNVDAMDFSQKKLKETFFKSYSGYPGGLKERRAKEVGEKDLREVLKHAISGMIKRNRLKSKMIKNLTLLHGDQN